MKRMTFLFLMTCTALTACSERAVAPVADPLLGVWERSTGTVHYLPSRLRRSPSGDVLSWNENNSSGELQIRWVFEETTWQLIETVTSADTTSKIQPGQVTYGASGRWQWWDEEATLIELLTQSSYELIVSDLPYLPLQEIIALEVVVFGDVARLGEDIYNRK